MEAAAGGGICGVGDLAFDDFEAGQHPVDSRGAAEQALGVGVKRGGEEFANRGVLDDFACVHDVDVVGDLCDDAERLADRLESFLETAGLPKRLGQCGVPREILPELATMAAGQWTAKFNPTPVGEAELGVIPEFFTATISSISSCSKPENFRDSE